MLLDCLINPVWCLDAFLRLDVQSECEVTRADVADFESNWQLKVLSLNNILTINSSGSVASDVIDDVASPLNFICDQLWQRDKMMS